MPNSRSISASQYAKTITSTPARRMPTTIVPNTWTPAGYIKSSINVYVDPSVKAQKKEKKMGWFRKKFMEWSRRAWEDSQMEPAGKDTIRSHDSINGNTSMRFTIYPASGGYVIEHYKQDRYKDSEGPSLTIVNNGDELGKAVEHILTLEALKA